MKKHTMNINALEAFAEIYKYKYSAQEDVEAPVECYNYISYKYIMTPCEIEVIAYLLHFYPDEVSYRNFTHLAEGWDEDMTRVFLSLESKALICWKEDDDDSMSHLSLNPNAIHGFQEEKCNESSLFKDCYDELRRCKPEDVMSHDWLNVFVASLKATGNEQLMLAYEKLEIAGLPISAQKLFWIMVIHFMHHFTKAFKADKFLRNGAQDICVLLKEGIVNAISCEGESKGKQEYILSPKAIRLLFFGHEDVIRYDELANYADVIKCADIEKKELFYSADAQIQIDGLRTMVSPDGFQRACGILARKKRPQSILSLLWGPPGTGKTESVKQLALESGRDIIVFDASKVLASDWGASEKLHRGLFRAYKYVAAVSESVPILLLNEADAVLSKRIANFDRAIDKSENIISNILLEEMEAMDGILIATTNLIDNIDPAFDRRFLYKIQLLNPDAVTRAKIWKSSIPELTESEAQTLAGDYTMSGAQINNVVAKRDLAELYYCGDRGYGYIKDLCEKELDGREAAERQYKRIGFLTQNM